MRKVLQSHMEIVLESKKFPAGTRVEVQMDALRLAYWMEVDSRGMLK